MAIFKAAAVQMRSGKEPERNAREFGVSLRGAGQGALRGAAS